MSTRDFVLPVLLISTSLFSTTFSSIIRPQGLVIVRLAPETASNLDSVPDKWKTLHPEYRAPQVEIHLLKDHVSPNANWMITNEYKYSGKAYDDAAKMTSITKEKIPRTGDDGTEEREKTRGDPDNNNKPDDFIPQIGFRNIITAPTYCPPGQRKDSKGRCRTIIT